MSPIALLTKGMPIFIEPMTSKSYDSPKAQKAQLDNPLPVLSRSLRVATNLNLKRRDAPGSKRVLGLSALHKMKASGILSLIAIMLSSCTQYTATWPMKVENSAAIYLDPKKSTLEEHIYVLSPLTDASRDSEEYRERMLEGLRHPETIKKPGGEYLYVPPSTVSDNIFGRMNKGDSHVYRLDRSKGRFYAIFNGIGMQCEYYHNEDGWWAIHPTVKFPQTLPSVK